MRTSAIKLLVIAICTLTGESVAQTYPTGPLRIIVPFPPGGGTDIVARMIVVKLTESWRQPVVVDNRPGANGTLGTSLAAKAAPDGHTMLIAPSGFAVNPSMYPKLPYNWEKDLSPVTQLAASPLLVVVHPSVPVKSIKDLIALAKRNPGQLNYASSGNGSPPHLATEHFKSLTGVNMVHIPYKGGGPALNDLLGGQVSLYFNAILQSLPHAKVGRLRALAVTSPQRYPSALDIPTVDESGVPGYEMTNWYGMFVPGGTAAAIVKILNAEVTRILKLPEIRDRLAVDGAIVVASTPEQFAAFLQQQVAKFSKIVQESGMKTEG